MMRFFESRMRLVAPLVVMCCLIGAGSQVAQAQGYTNDPNIADFTAPITSYATLSSYSANTGCTVSPFTPTSAELLSTSCRVFGGTLAGNGLSATAPQNWILASFSEPVPTIVVFPSIDHFGSAFDGYQYTIAGSNDGQNWTVLFDATGVTACVNNCNVNFPGEPFTLTGHTGTAPTSVNNVLTPQTPVGGGLPSGCSIPNPPPCQVGYIATFNFPTAYQFYAFGASTVAVAQGNADQELSAVGTIAAPRSGTFAPNSGALLTITGTVGATPVNRNIYDSQIHTGNVQQVPVGSGVSNCNANDQLFLTDAYVLQGGSSTGCDPGDPFEITQGTGTATISGAGYSFAVSTTYMPGCDSSTSICANGGSGTGLLTVANNSASAFSGTITLSGTSQTIGGPGCPANGMASDTSSAGLTAAGSEVGNSVTLALSSDSSNCGGWNADQMLPINQGQTTVFQFGADQLKIKPFNSISGDHVTFRPVPVPVGQFNLPGTLLTSSAPFNGEQCVSIADFAAPTGANLLNPVCPEFQTKCVVLNVDAPPSPCSDAETFLWLGELDGHLDPNAGYQTSGGVPEIGGVHFLGEKGVNCPQNLFAEDILSTYTGDSASDLPLTTGGRGTNCFVTTFDPNATVVAPGATISTFTGFQSPVINCAPAPTTCVPQSVQAGSAIPLIFKKTDSSGNPITDLTLCRSIDGTGCAGDWVFVGFGTFNCSTDLSTSLIMDDPAGASGLQNLGAAGLAPPGTYQFNWQTLKSQKGTCATPALEFSSGGWSVDVAEFKFK